MSNDNFLEIAINQMENHQTQTSGAWSINAEDFCDEAGLDYERAVDYQIMKEVDISEEYEAQLIEKHTQVLGYLSEEQLDKIRETSNLATINDDGYSQYFWQDIINQLKERGQQNDNYTR